MGQNNNHARQVNGGNNQDPRQVGQAVMPTREALTRSQLETLHAVVTTLSPFLLGDTERRSFFFHQVEEEVAKKKLDGGVALSASMTFMSVCDRIDAILKDQTRWDTSAHDKLYDAIAAVQKAQVDYLTAQADIVKMQARPSIQFKPLIANDGEHIIAYYGDITRNGYAIIGVGRTPQEALEDFDRAFLKTSQEQIIMAAESLDEKKRRQAAELTPPPAEPTLPATPTEQTQQAPKKLPYTKKYK